MSLTNHEELKRQQTSGELRSLDDIIAKFNDIWGRVEIS